MSQKKCYLQSLKWSIDFADTLFFYNSPCGFKVYTWSDVSFIAVNYMTDDKVLQQNWLQVLH